MDEWWGYANQLHKITAKIKGLLKEERKISTANKQGSFKNIPYITHKWGY